MMLFKIEGSIDWTIGTVANKTDNRTDDTRFERLMKRVVPPNSNKQSQDSSDKHIRQVYRVIGGRLDGVVCDVSEYKGEIKINIRVIQYTLYTFFREATELLTSQIKCPGYSVSLGVEYVPCTRK